jgi:hypothetical protein
MYVPRMYTWKRPPWDYEWRGNCDEIGKNSSHSLRNEMEIESL